MDSQFSGGFQENIICRCIDRVNFAYDEGGSRELLQAYRYLLQYANNSKWKCPSKSHMIKKIIEKGKEKFNKGEYSIVMEVYDILLQHQKDMAPQFRELLGDISLGTGQNPVLRNIYSDAQNIHEVSDSVVKCALYLYNKHKDVISSEQTKFGVTSGKDSHMTNIIAMYKYREEKLSMLSTMIKINRVHIQKIFNEVSDFGVGLSLENVFYALLIEIKKYLKETCADSDILKTLQQEIEEGHEYCATGRLGRLINVLQGYVSDNNLLIKIEDKDHCFAVVQTYLTTLLKNASEEIQDGITDWNDTFIAFIRKNINQKSKDWEKEYGKSFNTHVKYSVDKYFTREGIFVE